MDMKKFIRMNRQAIDRVIFRTLGDHPEALDDEERAEWCKVMKAFI